jgi:hypothetical protein
MCLVNPICLFRELWGWDPHTYLLVNWVSPVSFAWAVGRKCWPSSDAPSSLISMINLHNCLIFLVLLSKYHRQMVSGLVLVYLHTKDLMSCSEILQRKHQSESHSYSEVQYILVVSRNYSYCQIIFSCLACPTPTFRTNPHKAPQNLG